MFNSLYPNPILDFESRYAHRSLIDRLAAAQYAIRGLDYDTEMEIEREVRRITEEL